MKVVLDTNVILVSIPRQSKYRLIFEKILNSSLQIVISNDILNEYHEIITKKNNSIVASNVTELLINLPNVIKVNVYFPSQRSLQERGMSEAGTPRTMKLKRE